MPILVFISLFTLLDFVVLFSVGGQIGLLATLLLVMVTGIGGLHLIRREGAYTFARARERFNAGEVPSTELLTGAALIFGGALLMAPGFLSDAIGLACLIPDARRLLLKLLVWLGFRARFSATDTSGSYTSGGRTSQGANEWNAASGRRARNPGQRQSADEPMEGDFIARDEAFRRR